MILFIILYDIPLYVIGYNSSGILVKAGIVQQKASNLSVEDLNQGFYVVSFDKSYFRKIILK